MLRCCRGLLGLYLVSWLCVAASNAITAITAVLHYPTLDSGHQIPACQPGEGWSRGILVATPLVSYFWRPTGKRNRTGTRSYNQHYKVEDTNEKDMQAGEAVVTSAAPVRSTR
ncbi:hypothetical protein NDU88_010540 [Pleurodeles waltl]|uniref:Secreted protein n=1 Tax=Pleurodeles waltl TaxID=8319 RepID=A0AAV7Q0F5_PLEWA|nr:hypothetical protein NDU88_010540 [Pleurodeles waltl]